MKRWLGLLAALFVAGCAHGQVPIGLGGGVAPPPPPGGCSRFTGSDGGGCAGAPPTGSFQFASMSALTAVAIQGPAHQSILNTHPEPWPVAGLDYPVGYQGAQASLADPTTASLPSGCTYKATGGALSVPEVFCDAMTSGTLSGFDFSLHGGVALELGPHNTGTFTISDDNFVRGTAISGVWVYPVQFDDGVYDVTMISDSYDGGAQNPDAKTGYDINDLRDNNDTLTVEYDYIHNLRDRFFGGDNTTLVEKWNYVQDIGMTDDEHNEFNGNFPNTGSVIPLMDMEFNTIVTTPNVSVSSVDAPWRLTAVKSPSGVSGVTTLIVNGNTIVNNTAANCFAAYKCQHVSTVVTGFVDDGQGGGSYDGVAGNILTVTAIVSGPPVVPPMDLSGLQSVSALPGATTGASTNKSYTGIGYTGTYQLLCPGGGACVVAPTTMTLAGTQGAVSNAGEILLNITIPFVTSATITNNYVDPNGALDCVALGNIATVAGYIDDGLGGGAYDGKPGQVLTVTAFTPRTTDSLMAGNTLYLAGSVTPLAIPDPAIGSQISGTPGGVGVYNITSPAIAVTGKSWNVGVAIGSLTFSGNVSVGGTPGGTAVNKSGGSWNNFSATGIGYPATCAGAINK